MKKNRKIALALIAVLLISVLIVACGSKEPDTLEAYVAAGQGENDAITGVMDDDPNAFVEISGNTLEIKYTVEDEAITKDILDSALDGLSDTFKGMVTDMEKETGLTGINIKVTYVDKDGKEITSKTY